MDRRRATFLDYRISVSAHATQTETRIKTHEWKLGQHVGLCEGNDRIARSQLFTPTWTMYAQVMRPEQAEHYIWNMFDMTKVWPHGDFPLRPLAKLTLNRNVRSAPVCYRFLTNPIQARQLLSRHRAGRLLAVNHGTGHRA